MKNYTDINQQLKSVTREAIASGWTENSLAKSAGVPQRVINRWLASDEVTMRGDNMATLAAWFGMRLTKAKIPPR